MTDDEARALSELIQDYGAAAFIESDIRWPEVTLVVRFNCTEDWARFSRAFAADIMREEAA